MDLIGHSLYLQIVVYRAKGSPWKGELSAPPTEGIRSTPVRNNETLRRIRKRALSGGTFAHWVSEMRKLPLRIPPLPLPVTSKGGHGRVPFIETVQPPTAASLR